MRISPIFVLSQKCIIYFVTKGTKMVVFNHKNIYEESDIKGRFWSLSFYGYET
jgi:hypothetical protein